MLALYAPRSPPPKKQFYEKTDCFAVYGALHFFHILQYIEDNPEKLFGDQLYWYSPGRLRDTKYIVKNETITAIQKNGYEVPTAIVSPVLPYTTIFFFKSDVTLLYF